MLPRLHSKRKKARTDIDKNAVAKARSGTGAEGPGRRAGEMQARLSLAPEPNSVAGDQHILGRREKNIGQEASGTRMWCWSGMWLGS